MSEECYQPCWQVGKIQRLENLSLNWGKERRGVPVNLMELGVSVGAGAVLAAERTEAG